jgi:4-amino-4-deoxy-L-arabinose transferase-like glycosyltransferase
MTKGIFVIITIISGVFWLWIATRRYMQILHPKWWLALGLSLIVATPEFIALYLQFDVHPEKLIFGHHHVSGLRWYFIDSQFGRFFGTGYIVSTNPPPLHQLFFIHTFLWAFLPWSLVFPVAIYDSIKHYRAQLTETNHALIVLLGYFFTSFIMFSVTSFQVDHYTNIIFPFAAILCAKYLVAHAALNTRLFKVQIWLAIILVSLVATINALIMHGAALWFCVICECALVIWWVGTWGQIPLIKAICTAVTAISLTFISYTLINGYYYHRYDSGFWAAQVTNHKPAIAVVDYQFDSRALEFFSHNHYYLANSIAEIPQHLTEFYLVTPSNNWPAIESNFATWQLVTTIKGNTPERIIPNLISQQRLNANLTSYSIILIKQ